MDQSKLSATELDYSNVLTNLVEDYEDAAVPIPRVGDAALLRFLKWLNDQIPQVSSRIHRIAKAIVSLQIRDSAMTVSRVYLAIVHPSRIQDQLEHRCHSPM